VPRSARRPETTVNVPVGSTRTVELVANVEGDWAFHCHKSHHTMNAMGHNVPTMIGVDQRGIAEKISKLVPDYMAMGSAGMAEMGSMEMPLPDNTLPMMSGQGPFGPLEMGGMFSVVKVHPNVKPGDYKDPGWYRHPEGTQASEWTGDTPAVERAGAPQADGSEMQVQKPSGHGGH